MTKLFSPLNMCGYSIWDYKLIRKLRIFHYNVNTSILIKYTLHIVIYKKKVCICPRVKEHTAIKMILGEAYQLKRLKQPLTSHDLCLVICQAEDLEMYMGAKATGPQHCADFKLLEDYFLVKTSRPSWGGFNAWCYDCMIYHSISQHQ